LLDLVGCRESGAYLLASLTAFSNVLLSGKCHPDITSILFGGRFVALNKKSGGIRPIAAGFTLRRLHVSKCANPFTVSNLASFFAPRQLGARAADKQKECLSLRLAQYTRVSINKQVAVDS